MATGQLPADPLDVLYSALPNWLPEYLIIQQPAPWRQQLLRYSGLYRALTIHSPAAPGVRPVQTNTRALSYFIENLQAMQAECRRWGVELVLLTPAINEAAIPSEIWKLRENDVVTASSMRKVIYDFRTALLDLDGEQGIQVLEHRLSGANRVGGDQFVDFMHPSAVGYRCIAEDVLAALVARGVCQSAASAL